MSDTRLPVGVDVRSRASATPAPELREITEDDGRRLLRIVLGGSRSVVTWRRAQIVSLAAQKMSPAEVGEVVSADLGSVCNVIDNFNRDRFDSLDPGYRGGRSRTFGPAEREQTGGSR